MAVEQTPTMRAAGQVETVQPDPAIDAETPYAEE
jgi:hypothetical protein